MIYKLSIESIREKRGIISAFDMALRAYRNTQVLAGYLVAGGTYLTQKEYDKLGNEMKTYYIAAEEPNQYKEKV